MSVSLTSSSSRILEAEDFVSSLGNGDSKGAEADKACESHRDDVRLSGLVASTVAPSLGNGDGKGPESDKASGSHTDGVGLSGLSVGATVIKGRDFTEGIACGFEECEECRRGERGDELEDPFRSQEERLREPLLGSGRVRDSSSNPSYLIKIRDRIMRIINRFFKCYCCSRRYTRTDFPDVVFLESLDFSREQ